MENNLFKYKNTKGDIFTTHYLNVVDICSMNLTEIISIPDTIRYLFCYNNKLTSLPEVLPNDLKVLTCYHNKIKQLPDLKNYKLMDVGCDMCCFEDYMLEMKDVNFNLFC